MLPNFVIFLVYDQISSLKKNSAFYINKTYKYKKDFMYILTANFSFI